MRRYDSFIWPKKTTIAAMQQYIATKLVGSPPHYTESSYTTQIHEGATHDKPGTGGTAAGKRGSDPRTYASSGVPSAISAKGPKTPRERRDISCDHRGLEHHSWPFRLFASTVPAGAAIAFAARATATTNAGTNRALYLGWARARHAIGFFGFKSHPPGNRQFFVAATLSALATGAHTGISVVNGANGWRYDFYSWLYCVGEGCSQFRPVKSIFVRPPLSAQKPPAGNNLQVPGQLSKPSLWNSSGQPFMDAGWLYAQQSSYSGRSTEQLDDFKISHALIIRYSSYFSQ